MKTLLLAFAQDMPLARALTQLTGFEAGAFEHHRFPDGESLIRLRCDVKNMRVLVVCSLWQPDEKIIPLLLLAETARDLGASEVGLVAPYLAYMRQDKRFHPGEGVSSRYFARLLSNHFNWLATVDPHLHRHVSLSEIYSIPTRVVRAAPAIARWIQAEIRDPVLIGPDIESAQWVTEIAALAGAESIVLEKIRRGDRDVEILMPAMEKWRDKTPLLVDDIISTARTMQAAVRRIRETGLRAPVCLGVHALFTGDAYETLKAARPARIVTCNTVPHETNAIDLASDLARALQTELPEGESLR